MTRLSFDFGLFLRFGGVLDLFFLDLSRDFDLRSRDLDLRSRDFDFRSRDLRSLDLDRRDFSRDLDLLDRSRDLDLRFRSRDRDLLRGFLLSFIILSIFLAFDLLFGLTLSSFFSSSRCSKGFKTGPEKFDRIYQSLLKSTSYSKTTAHL